MAGIDRRVAGKGSGVDVGAAVGMGVRVCVGNAVATGSWKAGVLSMRK